MSISLNRWKGIKYVDFFHLPQFQRNLKQLYRKQAHLLLWMSTTP